MNNHINKSNKNNNIFYAQSGGVTSVINATACGLIETARLYPDTFNKVLVGKNGIIGALNDQLIDTSLESPEDIAKLRFTPAGAFGSCRHKLPSPEQHIEPYNKILEVFKKHNIGYFFYNGGGDSQDTAYKIAKLSQQSGYELICIGLPKTIDNDLPITDTCPGFGSVAKYVAVSIREAGLDVLSMSETSTKIFVMEVMGRHTGWIAAASGLAAETKNQAPHIILLPEIPFEQEKFLTRVQHCTQTYGHCAIVVSEGVKDKQGNLLQKSGLTDSFGHAQLGGVAPMIANLVTANLGYKNHWAVCDYLQRSARHIASKTDVEQSYALGQAGITFAKQGLSGVMLSIKRLSDLPYEWSIDHVPLEAVANQEKLLPREFITEDGFHITDKCRKYLAPLILGEDYPAYKNGLPDYVQLKNQLI
ncbi:MAG: 6-phosphofructokinase [Gammaproteobacteria bacterium]|nr:6-phosphofructokinase [Gammaproteobacteria bacterium]